jgi:cysteinyl-tRNA synthetase
MKYLGPKFDIHTGGIDHIAVHHNNELAQSEALSHELLAQYWLHNEHVIMEGGKKMAKSGEQFITLDHLATHQISPLGYRYWLLGASYRTPIQFSIEAVRQAEAGYRSLIQKIAHIMQLGALGTSGASFASPADSSLPLSDRAQAHISKFKAIINDDLHTAQAIAYLHESVLGDDLSASEFVQIITTCDHALGLDLIREATAYINKTVVDISDIPAVVIEYATQREVARAEKNWHEADRLRDAIVAEGFNIKDTSTGYVLEKTLL